MKPSLFLLPLAFCLVLQVKAEPLPEELALDVKMLSDALVDLHAELNADEVIYAQIQANTYDGYKDVVAAIFTIGGWGGGNSETQYLAVFDINDIDENATEKNEYSLMSVIPIGGRGDRFFDSIGTLGGNIVLFGLEYLDDDPSCCPSQPITVLVSIGRRGVLEPADRLRTGPAK